MKFQLCYASEATASDKHILNDLRNILNEARHFNIKHNVHGALFFAVKSSQLWYDKAFL